MASDLKIEIFAYYSHCTCIQRELEREVLKKILFIYEDECRKDRSYKEVCDMIFISAINCRVLLFQTIFTKELDFKEAMKWKSVSECYDHLTRICDKDESFGHLSVFERMIATSGFIVHVCQCAIPDHPLGVINFGHIIWAMYFDKFTETFYKEGGWTELKRVAKRYDLLSKAFFYHLANSSPRTIPRISKQASVNYIKFKDTFKYDNKSKGKNHISKDWVKFNIEHFEEYVRIPFSYKSFNYVEMELLLQDLKLICDSIVQYNTNKDEILEKKHQGGFCTTGKEYSETFNSYETNEDLQIRTPATRETLCNEILNSRKDFETKPQEEFLISNEKVETHEIIDKIANFEDDKMLSCGVEPPTIKCEVNVDEYTHEKDNNLNKILCQQLQTSKEISPIISDLDSCYNIASIDGNNENDLDDTSFQRHGVKQQEEEMNGTDVLFTNWRDDSKCSSKIPSDKLPDPMDLCSEKEIVESHVGKETSLNGLELNFNAKKEGYNDNVEISNNVYSNQVIATQSDRNWVPTKDIAHVNEAKKNYDGRIYPNKEPNILREEKNDPEIRNFLRMILVLDDRQGIQYVRESLGCSEESKEISQVSSKKKKKKTKSKSRK